MSIINFKINYLKLNNILNKIYFYYYNLKLIIKKEIKYLDKYSLANIIANKINYQIENERRIENSLSFFKVIELINEYEDIGDKDIVRMIIYAIEQLNIFEENKNNLIVDAIINDINFKYSMLI